MGKKHIIVLVLTAIFSSLSLYAQERDTITFVDEFATNSINQTVLPVLPKNEQLSSLNRGSIEFTYKTEIADTFKTAIMAAGDIWSHYLSNKAIMEIDVNYTSGLSNDVTTDVIYVNQDSLAYPAGLHAFLGFVTNEDAISCGIININSDIDWNCSFSSDSLLSTNNLTYAMLRSIAHILGFGSTVREIEFRGTKTILGSNLQISPFDNIIFNSNGEMMNELPCYSNRTDNVAAKTYCQPEDGVSIYAFNQSNSYRLYAPSVFNTNKSLKYLDNPESLMHHEIFAGDKIQRIDDVTINLLREIGWELTSNNGVKIICDDIDSTGIASALQRYNFRLQNSIGGVISDAEWVYRLPLNDGNDTIIATSNNSQTFTIPSLSDATHFNRNIHGDIYGTIEFTGKINGEDVYDTFNLSLELEPKIKNVTITNITSIENGFYSISFTVEYAGCSQLRVEKVHEYTSGVPVYYIDEPYIAHVTVRAIMPDQWAWIDIYATNQYGEDIYTIELPALINLYDNAGVQFVPENETDCLIDVYNAQGQLLLKDVPASSLNTLPTGLYILQYNDSYGNCVKTEKFYKQ